MATSDYFSDLKDQLLSLGKDKKKALILASLSLFFLLFSYPMIRSAAEAIFLESYGAKSSPLAWLYSIVALSISISIFNKLQVSKSVQTIFWLIGLSTFAILSIAVFFINKDVKLLSYVLIIWKEVYIVLMVHLVLGYVNSILSYKLAKTIYGPMGALGSIGGIIGGQVTSKYVGALGGAEGVAIFGSVFIVVSCICFQLTGPKFSRLDDTNDRKNESPLHSILDVKKYVFLIALIILLSQFCINLANFKFNIMLERFVQTKAEKVSYLGNLYSSINGVSLFMQVLVIPVLFNLVKNRSIHFFIPVFFFLISGLGVSLGSASLFPVALTFVMFKGTDYSLFSAAKEMLYFPLVTRQKYGAKYVVDMVVYRFAKGLISFLLIFYQSETFVDICLSICLIVWIFILIPLFIEQKKVLKVNKEYL
ncbi:Npt1/Npt2 family nucleotide transporter [Halobacteriovorax sp. HLS]|uniref:Npt1/Npt2 family nucleotide transporter n=1 Tax=Halobacteriovorax sp. HLS TaxID=2234000 RepID=UPI000FDB318B|nr:Npt1/Npt2 family nucleotide transporter [Halobacteriovorax sp. HLS]